MINKSDSSYMEYALNLANSKLGLVSPNPSVGCVIVKNDIIVGIGITANGGRPHAETQAIAMAGKNAIGATAYVTLEPCAHETTTPSCAKELVKASISRCVIAVKDIDSRTCGKGIKILEQAGIKVETGLLEKKAKSLNAGFFSVLEKKRPLFTAKIATSLDGKIALSNGMSKWITSDLSRKYGHYLRATHDCILIGENTLRLDNPTLDCRINGMENQSPARIVLGNNIPKDSKILNDGGITHIISGELEKVSSKIIELGYNSCLIEGGSNVITKFISAGLVDRLAVFSSPNIIGGDGLSCIKDLGIIDINNIMKYKMLSSREIGSDMFRLFEKE